MTDTERMRLLLLVHIIATSLVTAYLMLITALAGLRLEWHRHLVP